MENKEEMTIEEMTIEKKTIGEIIDNLMENPAVVIKELTRLYEECQKVNEDLKIKLKKKQSIIDYLKGKIAVYEKFFKFGGFKQ